MNKNFTILSLLLLLAFATSGFAVPYQAGDYTVDIDVRNSAMFPVLDAKISCFQWDAKHIIAEVSAQGYQYTKSIINIRENQTWYKKDFILRDLERKFLVTDLNGNEIVSAYLRLDQFGIPSDHFGITAYIPKADWVGKSPENVNVFDSFWGRPLKKTCEISTHEDYYCVKLTITRKALKWSGSKIYVVFKNNNRIRRKTIHVALKNLAHFENDISVKPADLNGLANFIFHNIDKNEIEKNLHTVPVTLQKYYSFSDKFNSLHKKNNVF